MVGHITHDRYEGGFVAGGCAFYGAKVHNELERETFLLGAVGEDFACEEAIGELNYQLERRGETTVFANYYPSRGPRVQLLEASGPPILPKNAPPRWLKADLVHLAPVLGEVDLQAWKAAVGDGLLAINVQGWIKEAGPLVDASALEAGQQRGLRGQARQVVQRPWEVTPEELNGVDIACLSEEDLIGQGDLLERLVQTIPIVALTFGEKGSRIFVNGEPRSVGIFETDAVDPTGAGDVFAAAFCHKIASGIHPVEAARFAAAAASICVEAIGPGALHRLGEAEQRARQVPVAETLSL